MNPFDVTQSFLELCQGRTLPIPWLTAGFRKGVEALGFRYFAYCSHVDPLHPPPHAIMMHTYPARWADWVSEKRLYEIDPVLQLAERDLDPFFWDAAFQTASITARQRKVLTEGARYGLAHGYTIPIHLSWLPGVLRASCSVVPDSVRLDPSHYTAVCTMAIFHFTAMSRAQGYSEATISIKLTRRERECLAWAALGMTDWAIGERLHLSEGTVHSHFKELLPRLDATTRAEAVYKALKSGQITFGDVESRKDGNPLEKVTIARSRRR